MEYKEKDGDDVDPEIVQHCVPFRGIFKGCTSKGNVISHLPSGNISVFNILDPSQKYTVRGPKSVGPVDQYRKELVFGGASGVRSLPLMEYTTGVKFVEPGESVSDVRREHKNRFGGPFAKNLMPSPNWHRLRQSRKRNKALAKKLVKNQGIKVVKKEGAMAAATTLATEDLELRGVKDKKVEK